MDCNIQLLQLLKITLSSYFSVNTCVAAPLFEEFLLLFSYKFCHTLYGPHYGSNLLLYIWILSLIIGLLLFLSKTTLFARRKLQGVLTHIWRRDIWCWGYSLHYGDPWIRFLIHVLFRSDLLLLYSYSKISEHYCRSANLDLKYTLCVSCFAQNPKGNL